MWHVELFTKVTAPSKRICYCSHSPNLILKIWKKKKEKIKQQNKTAKKQQLLYEQQEMV